MEAGTKGTRAWLSALVTLALALCLAVLPGCGGVDDDVAASDDGASTSTQETPQDADDASQDATEAGDATTSVTEDGEYTSKDEVAAYIHEFGHLPSNYISKTKAKRAGWVSSEGNLWDVCPGKSIGGSQFWNDDGLLPDEDGRTWTECDINYQGGFRGPERIVFSNDGLVYYTGDHYQTFERLY